MTKAERTKAFIIERTAPIFNTYGYAGTSLSHMERATGLTRGSIYANFSGKEDVALEAFKYNMRGITSKIASRISDSNSPIDKLKALIDYYRSDFLRDYLATGCPIANLAPEVDDTHEGLRKVVNDAIGRLFDTIVSIVVQGIEENQIIKGVNPKDVARQLVSAIEGGLMISKSTGNIGYLTSAIELCELKIDAIRA